MGPANIVLRPDFARFQFTEIELSAVAPWSTILGFNTQQLPATSIDPSLEIPNIKPARYLSLDLNPHYVFLFPNNAVPIGGDNSPLLADAINRLYSYRIDGVQYRSAVENNILIEKGSTRIVTFDNLQVIMAVRNFSSLITSTAVIPDLGLDGVGVCRLTPVVTAYY